MIKNICINAESVVRKPRTEVGVSVFVAAQEKLH